MPEFIGTKTAALMVKNPKLRPQDMYGIFKIINPYVISNGYYQITKEDFETFCKRNRIELNENIQQ